MMQRVTKNLTAVALAFLFAAAVLCATMAAPGQSLAAVSGCSQNDSPMEMAGCDNPSYLCGFDFAKNALSRGALSSVRSTDSLKNILGLALGAPSIDVSVDLSPPGARQWRTVSPAEAGKVSFRLFNSILNL